MVGQPISPLHTAETRGRTNISAPNIFKTLVRIATKIKLVNVMIILETIWVICQTIIVCL